MKISFTVQGVPAPQGSKIPQAIYNREGKPVMKNGRVITVVRNDSPKLDSWRGMVAWAARQVHGGPPVDGPVRMIVCFKRPRPKGHYGSGKKDTVLKASAPAYPTSRPDSVKLLRAVEDALTGIAWRDDSQVVHHDVRKVWGDRHETIVTIETLDDADEVFLQTAAQASK